MSLKILLVDDHRIVREGLKSLIEARSEHVVVGEARDGREALALVEKLRPDLILMDVAMPGLNGIEATRRISAMNGSAPILALSMHSDKKYVHSMMKSGARGYILKESAFEELLRAIDVVTRGKIYFSPRISEMLNENFVVRPYSEDSSGLDLLTDREKEVLQLIAEGHSTKEIAFQLEVSPKTIETYRRNITLKLEISSVAGLTLFAVREGLIRV